MGEEEIIKIFVLSNSHETKLPYFLFSSLLRRLVFFHFSLRDEYNEEINQSTHPHVVAAEHTGSFSKDFFSQGAVNEGFLGLFHKFLY